MPRPRLSTGLGEAGSLGAVAGWVSVSVTLEMVAPGAVSSQTYDISAKTAEGMDRLIAGLAAFAGDQFNIGESPLIMRERHRVALQQTAEALHRALKADQEELIAEELRLAARALGGLTVRVDVEDVLDVIFRDFCIGK